MNIEKRTGGWPSDRAGERGVKKRDDSDPDIAPCLGLINSHGQRGRVARSSSLTYYRSAQASRVSCWNSSWDISKTGTP